ncbi:HpcH/HpaI aldolase family protein [Rhodococcus opacus]|uniref:HpcH/HpaI aldolase family protein n=1 Tax=Rhodococcus opacus TaxID=37919 RepID=UPI002475AE91|nr:aldolase/citrate lyase family protein [Rhodococcus opacus]MDH6291342.1 4-hydroxy-2-oxoheptanedioate aldolase [Rhodococcus opacus]
MVVRVVSSIEIVGVAKACGFDSFYVDMEHSPISLDTTSQICIAALAAGIAPFVRIPSADPHVIARVLDGGALGIIVPHVQDAEQARQAVAAAKFSPLGNRSVTVGVPHLGYGPRSVVEARREMNDATMVVAMIETWDAVQKADEIAAVEGVDILLIGTNDLTSELGLDGQFDHTRVDEAYRTVLAATARHGKTTGVGGLASAPELVAKYVALGARYVSSGADLSFMLSAGRTKAAQIHALPTSP